MMRRLTVLYDAACPLCCRFRAWLERQPLLVPVGFVAAGSEEARRQFPTLDHTRTLEQVTVVADDGAVWTDEHAWVMCLWATFGHRPLAERLARPSGLPFARAAAQAAAGLRHLAQITAQGDDYIDDCAGSCTPLAQG
jgi:predicted DCC family thiol-disulfide oxidoreductase YuxK